MSGESWRIVLVTPGRRITSELLPVVSSEMPSAQVIELQGFPTDGQLGDAGRAGSICFLDLITDATAGLATLAAIIRANPDVPVVSLIPAENPQLILQALRTGAKDFLTQPFTADQFRTVIEKLAQIIPALSAEHGKVISVIPAKGACGASTVAFNLAYFLKKAGAKRTLLADLDPLTGTQAFQMKLKPGFSFLEILSYSTSLDADLWKGVVQNFSGVDVLLSPDNPVEGAQEAGDTSAILEFARKMYDVVVADLGNAYGEWSLSAARTSDEILLVTTNELPALQSAQRAINYYINHAIPRQRIRLVLNRFHRDVGLTKDMVETALQTEVYQLVSSDYESVQHALLEGRPLAGSTPIGKSISALANRLLGVDKEAAKPKPEKAASSGLSGLFGLFSRST